MAERRRPHTEYSDDELLDLALRLTSAVHDTIRDGGTLHPPFRRRELLDEAQTLVDVVKVREQRRTNDVAALDAIFEHGDEDERAKAFGRLTRLARSSN